MSEMKRVNISIPLELHKEVKVIFAKQETNLSVEVAKFLESLAQQYGDREPTQMQRYDAYKALNLEERVEFNMDRSRKDHAKWDPDSTFDEEGTRVRWVANITREMEKEVAQ